MNYLTKLRFIIFFVFLLVLFFIYKITTATLNAYIASAYEKNLDILKGNYQSSTDLYEVVAHSLYDSVINQENTLSLLSEAKTTEDIKKTKELQKQLSEPANHH